MLKGFEKGTALAAAALIVLGTVSGCGKDNTGGQAAENLAVSETADSYEENTAGEQNTADIEEDVADIQIAFYNTVVPNSENLSRIEDAINAITVPEIQTQVHITVINMGQWDQQINLMISSGEQLDLMPTFFFGSTAFSTMAANNQLMSLDDLLENYGQGILETLPESYLETTTYSNGVLAIPMYKDNVSKLYYAMRQDVLEQLGLEEQADNIRSMQDIETILQEVKDRTDLVPICETSASGVIAFQSLLISGDFEDAFFYDRLISDYIVSANDQPETVVSLYDLPEYSETVALFNDWYEKGLINRDALTSELHAENHIAEGNTFSSFYSAEISTRNAFAVKAQYPVKIIEVCELPLSTSSVNTLTWTIPVTSAEPEAAMKFLNMMFTDERIVNLMNYGQENVDYVVNEDGTFGFPEGQDISSVGYHFETTWLFANQYLAGVWEGDEPGIRQQALEVNENAVYSPIFGFAASSSGMDTQMAGILSAYNEYSGGLQCGVLDLEETLPEYQKKLDAAGIDEVVENVQSQLDAWLSEKGGTPK